MCGIAGIVNLQQPKPISSDALRRMVSIQQHRGPDETGAYLDDRIGLAHSRLSIIDLSEGTQPIHNEDKSLWIIYNGEVFNYPELRQELVSRCPQHAQAVCRHLASDDESCLNTGRSHFQ